MTDVALILGGANTVFKDMQEAYKLFEPACVIGINDVLQEIPEINVAVSMHPNKMPTWLKNRENNGYPPITSVWSTFDRKAPAGLKLQFTKNRRGGSGLLAICVARELKYPKIVLAGVPMKPEHGHYFSELTWKECHLYRAVFERDKSLKMDVRSLSGWTREQFGVPTKAWLQE